MDDVFESIYSTIISNTQKSPGKVKAGFLIQSSITTLIFQSTIKLLKEINHPKTASLIFKISMIMDTVNGVWSDIYIK